MPSSLQTFDFHAVIVITIIIINVINIITIIIISVIGTSIININIIIVIIIVIKSTCLPAILHSSFFKGSSAGLLLLYGRLMPIASIALAIVLAVYMPPHAPAPGHAFLLMSNLCVSSIRLAAYAPATIALPGIKCCFYATLGEIITG